MKTVYVGTNKKLKKKIQSKSEKRKNMQKQSLLEPIVIDEKNGLVFNNEQDLYSHFKPQIDSLEAEFQKLRTKGDYTDSELEILMSYLDLTLDQPDRIWMDEETFKDVPIYHFHRQCEWEGQICHYVASAYVEEESPTFIFIHFGTKSEKLAQKFQRGHLIYDRMFEVYEPAYIEGDALIEGDTLAFGLFSAMMKIRAEKDIPIDKFKDFGKYREETIENPDEIWKSQNLQGQNLVTFMKEFPDSEYSKDLHYIVVTQEENAAGHVHTLLFSFPTVDLTLVDRYRHGENLQAEEVVQENSH